MANSVEFAKNYTGILDEVYQRASVSGVLNSGRRMVRAGRGAKEILIPKISVTGLGDYTRNVGYKTGAITYEFETKTFNYDRGIRLFADVMDVEEAGVNDCFVEAGSELQRTQVAPEADAFTFSQIASRLRPRVLVLVHDGWPDGHAIRRHLAEHGVAERRAPNGPLEPVDRDPGVLLVAFEDVGGVVHALGTHERVRRLLELCHVLQHILPKGRVDRLNDDPHLYPLSLLIEAA